MVQPNITKMWYYSEKGEPQGPISFPQLVQLATDGVIFPGETKVWCEGMADWVDAQEVEGLFLPESTILSHEADAEGLFPQHSFLAPQKVKAVSFPYILAVLIFEGLVLVTGAVMMVITYVNSILTVPGFDTVRALSSSGNMVLVVGGVMFLTSLIHITYVLLQVVYRMWALIPPALARTTPERAVGLSLIPYFNIYWAFVVYKGWALDYERYVREGRIARAPKVSQRTFSSYPMMNLLVQIYHIPFLGWLLAPLFFLMSAFIYLKILREACVVINYFALEYRPFNPHP